mmetsp:Transcript_43438/g.114695  ORF Transcript_43438/g.114695 Transcript_43438/m.114695 type:complete len:155 (+) Transcript_43438:267-731(+)
MSRIAHARAQVLQARGLASVSPSSRDSRRVKDARRNGELVQMPATALLLRPLPLHLLLPRAANDATRSCDLRRTVNDDFLRAVNGELMRRIGLFCPIMSDDPLRFMYDERRWLDEDMRRRLLLATSAPSNFAIILWPTSLWRSPLMNPTAIPRV